MRKTNKIIIVLLILLSLVFIGCSSVKVNSFDVTGKDYLLIGEGMKLTVTVDPKDTDLSQIKWSSSDTNVATVENGEVKAIGLGTCVIKAKLGNKTVEHNLEVLDAMPNNDIFKTPVVVTEAPKQYEKVELALEETVSGYVEEHYNPYNYSQINVYGVFTSPSGKEIKAPGFWYRDYDITINTQYDYIGGVSGTPSTSKDEIQGLEKAEFKGDFHFRLRFLPNEAGNWTYTIKVEEKGYEVQSLTGSINVNEYTDETYRGIVAIDETTNRHFVHGNGSTFVPVGLNMCWWTNSSRKTFDYDVWFDKFSDNGGNMVRLWMATWGFSLHWKKPYDSLDGGQESAARLDKVIGLAEESDIYVQLCLINHGQFSTTTNALWKSNPYNEKNGGILKNPEQFFSSKKAKANYKNELYYIIGRYGYSDHIMAWELFNEVDWTDYAETLGMYNILDWHDEMSKFVEEHDSYNHLITTSYKGTTGLAYELKSIDYVNPHDYGYQSKNVNVHLPATQEGIFKKYNKPVLSSEIGINWQSGGDTYKADPNGKSIRQSLFAGFMGGGAGGAMQWWWDSWIHPGNLYYQYKGAAVYANKLNLVGSDYSQLRTNNQVSVSNSNAGILGYSFSDRIYGYVYNKDWYYFSNDLSEINTNITAPLTDGNYTLTLYNTLTGETLQQTNITASEGKVNITIPAFSEDIAFIIE